MGYTASDAIARVKAKGFVSTASSLTDPEVLEWLNDALRSYIVPFLKAVRDEWFVSGSEDVTPDSNGRIPLPNSVASTIRTINWMNNGTPVPLTRIEPENAFAYQGQNGGNQPYGYMLKAYEIQLLPANVGSVTVRIDFMERPADMVLEGDAGECVDVNPLHLGDVTLDSTPLSWQSETPSTLDIISATSPFSTLQSGIGITSIVSDVVTFDTYPEVTAAQAAGGLWLSDPGTNPFPNVPIEFHPLLQRSVITELYAGTGDKRLDASMKLQTKMETELRNTLTPRTQGSPRPVVHRNAVGMRSFGRFW